MRIPAGVVVAAVVLGLMTLMGIGVCLLAIVGVFLAPAISSLPGARVIMAVTDILMLGWFVFCAWTVVGLLLMRKWARYAVIAIGAVMFFFSAIGAVGVVLVRNLAPPAGAAPPPVPMSTIFMAIAGFYGLVALLCAWWVVYFNLHSVRAAFSGAARSGEALAAPAPEGMAGWRMVIVIWAWLMLVSVLYLPVMLAMRLPVFLYGVTLRGGGATAALLILVAVQVFLGVGLLKKWKPAWYAGVFWQIYSIGMLGTFLLPSVWTRFMTYQHELMQRWVLVPNQPVFDMRPFMGLGMVLGIVIVLVLSAALVQRRADYLHA